VAEARVAIAELDRQLVPLPKQAQHLNRLISTRINVSTFFDLSRLEPISTIEIGPRAALVARSAEWLRLAKLARLLAWISLGWLCIEGSIAFAAGIVAGSIALVGRTARAAAPRRQLLPPPPYVVVEALLALAVERHAETSWFGVGPAVGSLLICPASASPSAASEGGSAVTLKQLRGDSARAVF
jgi:hypothetical protein